ncbi:MAG: hypothetical protein RIS64_2132 [Bacteroidota bacterium]|jgi:hypothetical protein
MKYLFVTALLSTTLACNPSNTPEQKVVSKTDTLAKAALSDASSEPKCDSKANLIEKFEQNGVLFERFSFTKGSDMQPEWLKITVGKQPCKILDISNLKDGYCKFQDWDKDGLKDLIMGNTAAQNYKVSLFNKQNNDFVEIDNYFNDESWDFDIAKGLKMDHSDNNTNRYHYNFEDIYNLYEFKKGQFRLLSQIFFTIDDESQTKDCTIQIRKCKTQDDFKEMPVDATFFGGIRKKAQAIHAVRSKNDFQYQLNEKLTDAQRKAYEPKYQQAETASQLEHDAWAKEAKLIVENYWRKNIDLFTK